MSNGERWAFSNESLRNNTNSLIIKLQTSNFIKIIQAHLHLCWNKKKVYKLKADQKKKRRRKRTRRKTACTTR